MPEPLSFQAPKGTRDVLPPESGRWRALVDVFAELAEAIGYGEVVSPMFEDIGVFARIGENTEIVGKEMYEFRDRDDRHLALRPELTASICRAFAQHRPPMPWKIWYQGPLFRYEKPQAGRYRQFTQLGAEVLGTEDPHADVEIIALARRFYDALGLRQVRLDLNSLGDATCRPAYLDALTSYLAAHEGELSEQSRATLAANPLRVLDSKREADLPVIAAAPLMVDFLTSEPAAHFQAVCDGLAALGIDYRISPRLVRGLDYYTMTTFEFAADALDTAQNAVGGGGRYDGLVEDLGGPPTPGIGFALGIERILLACDAEGVFDGPSGEPDVFVVDLTGGREALRLTTELAAAGLRVDRAFDDRSAKAQMRAANRSGARLAAIVGDAEVDAATVEVKDLESGDQTTVARADLAEHLRRVVT